MPSLFSIVVVQRWHELQLVCREGYAYAPPGTNVTGMCPGSGAVANAAPAGELRIFGAEHLSGDGVTTDNDSVRTVLVGTAATSIMVAREGDTAPESVGSYMAMFGENRLSGGGLVAFNGALTLPGGSTTSGIWAADSSGIRTVALEGTAASDYGNFTGFYGAPSIGGNGDICFIAFLSSGPDGLYCEIDDVLQVVVREDDTSPALATGETFGNLLWMPVVNTHGQVLFFSHVADASGFDVTIWMRDTSGTLILIARASDPLEVSPGIFKTVYTIDTPTGDYPSSIGSGNASAFNDRGEIVFLADFTDGSEGIFVARPEPFETGYIFADGFESGDTSAW